MKQNEDNEHVHNISLGMNRPSRVVDPVFNNKQIGGEHYSKHKIQPWTIIDEYGLNFYEGNILKYLLRKKDNRVEDLEKLIHYAEKEIINVKM